MISSSDHLRESLLRSDAEFRQLAEQHQELDNRLTELSRQVSRSSGEESERATLKKRKLQVKDRMERMLREHRSLSEPSPALQPHARG